MTTEGESGRARGTSDGGVLLRPSRLKMVFRSESTMAAAPGDGATPQEGQYLQEDSGADMTMVDSKEWCALGYTTSVRLYAGTAKVSDDAKRIDAVAPLVLVMDGVLTNGEPTYAHYSFLRPGSSVLYGRMGKTSLAKRHAALRL